MTTPARRALLTAALGFLEIHWRAEPPAPAIVLARWMSSWTGVGAYRLPAIAVGLRWSVPPSWRNRLRRPSLADRCSAISGFRRASRSGPGFSRRWGLGIGGGERQASRGPLRSPPRSPALAQENADAWSSSSPDRAPARPAGDLRPDRALGKEETRRRGTLRASQGRRHGTRTRGGGPRHPQTLLSIHRGPGFFRGGKHCLRAGAVR